MDKKDGGPIDLESLRGFTPGPHPDAQPAPDECFCDRMYPDSNPNASCGDCPTRDYAPKPAPASAQVDGAGELPPLPEPTCLGFRNPCGITQLPDMGIYGYTADQVRACQREAIAALRQPVPDAWTPSGIEYDRSIHSNPDAKAWADMFVETFPGLADKRDLMIGWFASARTVCGDPPGPASGQPNNYRDAYEGARADLLDWKGRAQRAEATLRALGYTGIDASQPPAPTADGAGELAAKPSECANGCPAQQVCDYCQKAGGEWRERWEGSGPQKGWHIVESARLHNNAHIAYLGESPTSEAVTAIVMAHNAALASQQESRND